MKKPFLFLILVFFSASSFNFLITPGNTLQTPTAPPNTVFLKHPMAADLNVFFAQTTVFTLYVFQIGSAQNLQNLLGKLSKDKALSTCVAGSVNGDFQAIEVNLKQIQNKAWFVNWLKNAGLKTVKINNDTVKNLDQL